MNMPSFYRQQFTIHTRRRIEVVDITGKVQEIVKSSGIKDGIIQVFVPHATAAIIANEWESGLLEDYVRLIEKLFEPGGEWKHNIIDNNAHAHLGAALIGASRTFPLENGRLIRGTWQNIMLFELDGPRTRKVIVTIIGFK